LRAKRQTVHDDDDVRAWFASHVVCDTELWVAEDRAGTLVGIAPDAASALAWSGALRSRWWSGTDGF
jgi:hypothetical protein